MYQRGHFGAHTMCDTVAAGLLMCCGNVPTQGRGQEPPHFFGRFPCFSVVQSAAELSCGQTLREMYPQGGQMSPIIKGHGLFQKIKMLGKLLDLVLCKALSQAKNNNAPNNAGG